MKAEQAVARQTYSNGGIAAEMHKHSSRQCRQGRSAIFTHSAVTAGYRALSVWGGAMNASAWDVSCAGPVGCFYWAFPDTRTPFPCSSHEISNVCTWVSHWPRGSAHTPGAYWSTGSRFQEDVGTMVTRGCAGAEVCCRSQGVIVKRCTDSKRM